MKISTVITLYNLEKYIDDAIQSVLRQTRQPDEIIVVDDCSTDRSADIVCKYGHRITYIKQEKNIGALWNSLSGLKAATGDIVAFLDGDDVWMVESRGRASFAFEPSQTFRIACEFPRQKLQSEFALQTLVARQIYFAHASNTEDRNYFVGAEAFPNE